MKLYEIPKNSIINAKTKNDKDEVLGTQIKFHHLDGMYSYCTIVGRDNNVCHLGASQELELQADGTYNLTNTQ